MEKADNETAGLHDAIREYIKHYVNYNLSNHLSKLKELTSLSFKLASPKAEAAVLQVP
jgi:hypothetical protein